MRPHLRAAVGPTPRVPAGVQLLYFIFDVMVLRGKDVMQEPLSTRRELLQSLLPKLAEPVRHVPPFDVDLTIMIRSVKEQGFEGDRETR